MSECNKCNGTLFVCENHPDQEAHQCKHCGGAGMPCECTKISKPIGNTEQLAEPVAVRYDFDGYGYLYMDAGSGSDWASRVKDCEFLYTHPIRELSDEEIKECCKKVGVIIHVEYLPSWIKELSDELIKASSVGTRARLSCS